MPFKYAFFFSYRHGTGKFVQTMTDRLYEALRGEAEATFGSDELVFRDTVRMNDGDFLNNSLSEALCQSVCMILVYRPGYFSKQHPYCTREFLAMTRLEKNRLKKLPEAERAHSLIIPVVLRDTVGVPGVLRKRICRDFSKLLLSDGDMSEHPKYAPVLNEIVRYVAGRAKVFSTSGVEPEEPRTVRLPAEDTALRWLKGIPESKIPFFGR
jgi:hypothetical protein